MGTGELADLQRFYEANPAYHRLVSGEDPGPDAARESLEAMPPPEWPLGRKWMLLARDADGRVQAVVDVLQDLFAPGVWSLGFFMVAERWHGTGRAADLHEALIAWMRAHGGTWCRLGVVASNVRGERFWRARGYEPVRIREDYPVGPRRHRLHVMVRALSGAADWAAYRRLVPRDDPAAP